MKYRQKPVVIDAVQWNLLDPLGLYMSLPLMFGVKEHPFKLTNYGLFIDTLEGEMHVSDGDYIVKGVKGEFYPVKKEIFLETYEKV